MKKILFVINTMGQAGAEKALLELLKKIDESEYEVFLYVLMGQGELCGSLPRNVHVLNRSLSNLSVLTCRGRMRMAATVFRAFWLHGLWLRKLRSIIQNFACMSKRKRVQSSKLFWRVLSDGGNRFKTEFDLAVAWLEGGAAYYVADHVRAKKKAAFLHIDYESAGYTKEMDQACWRWYDQIFAVSGEVKAGFQAFYPEYAEKVCIFHNYIDSDAICARANEPGGFSDRYEGIRLLTVGRLAYQKAYDIAIEAMSLLKEDGWNVRWYVLGEGEQRRHLERKIAGLGLKEDFLLLGAVENPYPYYKQADIYVHATRFEGKSIALQEAQSLGCAIVASDCDGNRELITDGKDGILCNLSPRAVAAGIEKLLKDKEKRKELGQMAKARKIPQEQEWFTELLPKDDDE